MKLLRPSLAKFLGITSGTLFVVFLAFRFAVYGHMYKAPNDPYGISDIIEFGLGVTLMGAIAVSLLGAVALAIRGPRDNRIAAAWLFGACVLISVLIEPLHALAARWAP